GHGGRSGAAPGARDVALRPPPRPPQHARPGQAAFAQHVPDRGSQRRPTGARHRRPRRAADYHRRLPGSDRLRRPADPPGLGGRARREEAVAAPRIHTDGGMEISVEPGWPEAHAVYLRRVGYRVTRGPTAVVDAVYRDPASGAITGKGR